MPKNSQGLISEKKANTSKKGNEHPEPNILELAKMDKNECFLYFYV